jgi:hypothetical protein
LTDRLIKPGEEFCDRLAKHDLVRQGDEQRWNRREPLMIRDLVVRDETDELG